MKILLVNKFLYPNGGSETYIFELGKQLKAMGHEVQYFGMADERNIVDNHANCYTQNMNFRGKGLARFVYPFKIIYSIEARNKIKIVLEDFRPDIVHLNNFNFQLTPSIIYEVKKYKIPIIYTAHDYQLICPNHMCLDIRQGAVCEACIQKGFGQCTKKCCIHGSKVKSLIGTLEAGVYKLLGTYRHIDKIICPSEFMKKMLGTREELCDRTVMLHNFMTEKENNARSTSEDILSKYALYFGRYEKEKGVATLIEACRRLPEVEIRFAGRGSLCENIESLPNASDCGFLNKADLNTMIAEASFTICPSEWYENCPFSVMESITSGTPVVGANIGGIPELIRDEVDGLLFESGNTDDLIEKMMYLWDNDEKCREYSINCSGVEYDTCEKYTEKVLAIYDDLLRCR